MRREEKLKYIAKILNSGKKIAHNDSSIIDTLETSSDAKEASKKRAFKRLLEHLKDRYPQIQTQKIGTTTYYFLEQDSSKIFYEYISTSEDISWLVQMISENNRGLFNKLEEDTKKRLSNILTREKDIFLFHNSPFDTFKTEKSKIIFNSLKEAVKNNQYRDIHYNFNNYKVLKDTKCLKLIFMENNWYVAVTTYIENSERLLFLRVAFIKEVKKSNRNRYQASQLKKYEEFFKTFQNPMTLFNVQKSKAHFLASSKVAKYFKPNMKKHFLSEKYIKENSDGSVEFTVEFTQAMEVLPFVKKWLPDIKIISPKHLKEQLESELKQYLNS